ncbi:MAG: hypothetical protein QOC65_1178 [Sphingomonadales bacterium]|nr:hypothetical protein [Sphingomonadales bacterium]
MRSMGSWHRQSHYPSTTLLVVPLPTACGGREEPRLNPSFGGFCYGPGRCCGC